MKIKKSNKFWKQAKLYIPGGNMILSKRPELMTPGHWPVYYKKTNGCEIEDIDGNKFYDLSLMGVGTNILGYRNKTVDKKVIKVVKNGNISTLNNLYELELAKLLIKIHPWAQQAKFARTGGEANAIAIRIARAATNNGKIAVCGYHGWHDWYLAANISNKNNLNKHLLKNIPVNGVPKELKKNIYTFDFNDFDRIKYLVEKKKVKIIKMEVRRNFEPKNNFLGKVRKLSNKHNIILIFDECTSGFRETYGGLHKKYKINPDMAIFGKAIGNGYPITAIIGKKKIMMCAEKTFISSTFLSEAIGPAAAIETIKYMKRNKTYEKISKLGKLIKQKWKIISQKNQLPIEVFGMDGIPKFKFIHKDSNYLKTVLSYEMLKRGFLASTAIYLSTAHTDKIIKKYLENLDGVFKKISTIIKKNNYKKLYKIKEATQDFGRLN
jgi:glutamate-1-semialdehyde aminotransferase|tara:strand:- start:4360 stop:5670 length:1311 start_codon:yes stop_codon:yes gene_type:complete